VLAHRRAHAAASLSTILLIEFCGPTSKKGRKQWKRKSGYHKRSFVETVFMRLKPIFPDRLKSRTEERQKVESTIRCMALNRMTKLGMPKSYAA
jgi:hypothetical protein